MKENRKYTSLFIVLTLLLSVVAVWFQTILVEHYIEAETGLYKVGVITPEAMCIFVILSVLLISTVSFVIRMDAIPFGLKPWSVNTCITSIVSGAALGLTSVLYFLSAKNVVVPGSTAELIGKLSFAVAILGVPAALFYLTNAFTFRQKPRFVLFLSFFTVLWTLIYLMSLYFDQSVFMNSPVKVIREISLVFLLLYQLFEIRALLGKPKAALYFMFSLITVFMLSTAFVPAFIDFIQSGNKIDLEVSCLIYIMSMILYVFSRAVDFALNCKLTKLKIRNDHSTHIN